MGMGNRESVFSGDRVPDLQDGKGSGDGWW